MVASAAYFFYAPMGLISETRASLEIKNTHFYGVFSHLQRNQNPLPYHLATPHFAALRRRLACGAVIAATRGADHTGMALCDQSPGATSEESEYRRWLPGLKARGGVPRQQVIVPVAELEIVSMPSRRWSSLVTLWRFST
jgi:hypothetical protein